MAIPAKVAGSLTSGTITIPTGTDWLNGTYTVYSITLSDANSSTTYKAGDWGLSGVQLSGGVAAILYPQLTSLTAPGANPIGLGQTVNLNYTISPGTDPVALVSFTYAGPDAYDSTMLLGSSEVITSTSSTSAGSTIPGRDG